MHLQKGTKHKCSIIIHKTEATREKRNAANAASR